MTILFFVLVFLHKSEHTFAQTYSALVLSLSWSNGLCETNDCTTQGERRFKIHGLWPNNPTTGIEIENCQPIISFPTTIDDWSNVTRSMMEEHWGSLLRMRTNIQFWSHEWSKHGTCIDTKINGAKVKNPEYYFSATLALFFRYNCHQLMEKLGRNFKKLGGVYNDHGTLITELEKIIGGSKDRLQIQIHCSDKVDFQYLVEVRIFLANDGSPLTKDKELISADNCKLGWILI
ncbi:putative ribonuclease T(2) [Lupinus albus]|uniref:Putative ribonuclease T(2) n=1 Tax=Lupinus albus TaxID=3870 RepID=A0A6A4PCJ4_LUPAL|nr:putative ribonuclease T(2) [Lupinus albus]